MRKLILVVIAITLFLKQVFGTFKNYGYHFEHNFSYRKLHLSNFLAALNLLAFLAHTALEWLVEAYRAVRNADPSRRTFFENLRTLLQFIPFDNWQHLMQFMLHGGLYYLVKLKVLNLELLCFYGLDLKK